jgi:hypothetical protein
MPGACYRCRRWICDHSPPDVLTFWTSSIWVAGNKADMQRPLHKQDTDDYFWARQRELETALE